MRYKNVLQPSVFLKLLLAFLVVVAPMYFFIIQVNMWGSNDARENMLQSINYKLGFLIQIVEQEFSNVMRAQNQLTNSKELQRLSNIDNTSSDVDKAMDILNLQADLRKLQDLSTYVAKVDVYIMAVNKKVSNESVYEISQHEEQFIMLCSSLETSTRPFIEWGGHYYLTIMDKSYYVTRGGAKKPSYVISIEIEERQLEGLLSKFLEYEQGNVTMVGGAAGISFTPKNEKKVIDNIKKYLAMQQYHENGDKTLSLVIDGRVVLATYEQSKMLDTMFVAYVPRESVFKKGEGYVRGMWAASIFIIIFIVLFALGIRRMVAEPLVKLANGFRRAKEGNLDIELKYKANDEFGFIYLSFNEMMGRLKELIEQVYEQKIHAQSAELKQLQYQISPHFLYNALYCIYRAAKFKDLEMVLKLSEHLGDYYRYITRGAAEETMLSHEVKHARDYLEVQSLRFDNRIDIEFDEIPQDCENIIVPRLILQPIIENAFGHGLEKKIKGGILKVSLRTEKNFLIVTVEDNGVEMSEEVLDELQKRIQSAGLGVENTGMLNVHRRLQIKFGGESGITVSKSDFGGMKVRMCIGINVDGGVKNVSLIDSR